MTEILMAADSHAELTVRGVVAVIERDGRFLMIRRSQTVVAPGAWCFPGGAIQAGETPEQALGREMMEELALRVRPVEEAWRWRRDDGGLELCWWRAEIVDGQPCPNPVEVEAFGWLTPDEIRNAPGILPNNITFLDHFLRD